MTNLEMIAEEGFGDFDSTFREGLGPSIKAGLEELGVKLFNLRYKKEDQTVTEDENGDQVVTTTIYKKVWLDELDNQRGEGFIGSHSHFGNMMGYVSDTESGLNYVFADSPMNRKGEGSISLKRLKKGSQLHEVWSEKNYLNLNPEYVDAEVTMEYAQARRKGAVPESHYLDRDPESGDPPPRYKPEDIEWKATVTPTEHAASDRVLKKFYEILAPAITSAKPSE